jgi:hypothetical protein
MRKRLFAAFLLLAAKAPAQNYTASNIIEGGKALVELIRVFKVPKTGLVQPAAVEKKDSCALKNITDLCIKNSTARNLVVTLYKRNGNLYEPGVLSYKILSKSQECLYELKSGVYKMKLEAEEEGKMVIYREGEIKLNACENMFKEIKEN